ncbi:hypothetical protein [Candidatus Xianfuyuplasma coldseepsis]|uniref:YwaF family protein n=1 Tax=Candidatus Xianfuyuplasma coldseepsis TaxID=2782163 RepID=A0A7L7KQ49_9MOLU|nr:hypothetical protein [Xianfuyuplasma coldseepsis]QMS84559.1 YwaF family protein [Xianfuyuplasma coldseepsis]
MFDPALKETFVTFGVSHFIAVAIIFTIVGLIVYNKDRLRESRYLNVIRYTLVILTLGQEVSLNIYRIVMGEWVIATSLPL